MPDNASGSDLFSFDRAQRTLSVPYPAQPYAPYAEAWKEFDKLQKAVRGQGLTRWIHWVFDMALFGGGAFGLHLLKGHKLIIAYGIGAIAIAEIYSYFSRRERFLHWQCPRCRSEWPGTKTEKDTRCKFCRLQLHQMAP